MKTTFEMPEMPEPSDDWRGRVREYLQNEMPETDRARFEAALVESAELREELSRTREVMNLLDGSRDDSIVRMVNAVLVQAIDAGASDLHVQPLRRNVVVRNRIDGVLQETMTLPKNVQQAVIDRLKVMADMHVDERRLPQDGRIPIKHDGRDYELRVNVLPTLYGEKITARILRWATDMPSLELYRESPIQMAALKRIALLDSGLFLVGGHAGTGKSTLLYALLVEAHANGRPGRNFLTVEDPTEMSLERYGISQTAVNQSKALGYAELMSALRYSDPDVIYCAQIQDKATLSEAISAATIGRLVLSGLHAVSAIGIVERLRDIGAENFRIADAINGLAAQRLVRRVDTRETEEYLPAADELSRLGLTPSDGPFHRGVSTDANRRTGFAGRVPLIEVVEVTPALRRLVAGNASAGQLSEAAFPGGEGSLIDGARRLVRAGLTTVEEANAALNSYPRI